jgi:mannose-6-phosphate isomerase-like protein (cupin superfamily)
MRKMLIGFAAIVVLFGQGAPAKAQGAASGPAKPAVILKAADIKVVNEKDPPTMPLSDRLVGLVDIGDYNVGIATLHRGKVRPQDLPNGLAHSEITEIYIIQSGEATLVTGGTMDNPKQQGTPSGTIGPTFSFGPLTNGVSRHVGPGDVVVIPANTPHYFSDVKSDELIYSIDRIDPHHVLFMPGDSRKGQVKDHYSFPPTPPPAVDTKSEQIQAAANQTGTGVVQMLSVTDVDHMYNVGVALLHRTPSGDSLLTHNDITEIYHIISGHAVLTTGGTLVDPKADTKVNPRIGPGYSAKTLTGGTDVEVGPGDVAIIPPNTPHSYSKVESDKIVYLVLRVDPHHVLSMPPEDMPGHKQ